LAPVIVEVIVEIIGELAAQQVDIDIAGAQHRGGVAVIDQRQQQMLKRCVFVTALIGEFESAVKGLFKTGRK